MIDILEIYKTNFLKKDLLTILTMWQTLNHKLLLKRLLSQTLHKINKKIGLTENVIHKINYLIMPQNNIKFLNKFLIEVQFPIENIN